MAAVWSMSMEQLGLEWRSVWAEGSSSTKTEEKMEFWDCVSAVTGGSTNTPLEVRGSESERVTVA